MIAIDLDGTLLSPAGQVTERTKAAIHRCLSAGMLVCFATGRNWTESRTVLDTVAHYDHAVFAGGAMVIDTRQEVTLHRTGVDPDLAREICKVLEDAGHAVLALQDTASAGVDYLISDEIPVNAETMHWMSVTAALSDHLSLNHQHRLSVSDRHSINHRLLLGHRLRLSGLSNRRRCSPAHRNHGLRPRTRPSRPQQGAAGPGPARHPDRGACAFAPRRDRSERRLPTSSEKTPGDIPRVSPDPDPPSRAAGTSRTRSRQCWTRGTCARSSSSVCSCS
jgi:hypothetical protein